MAVSICYIVPSPPTQKPPVPSVPLWGAGESVPVPAATKPSSASWSPGTDTDGTGRKGGHLDGDLTREAKMAGLAHEIWTEPGGFTLPSSKISRKSTNYASRENNGSLKYLKGTTNHVDDYVCVYIRAIVSL